MQDVLNVAEDRIKLVSVNPNRHHHKCDVEVSHCQVLVVRYESAPSDALVLLAGIDRSG